MTLPLLFAAALKVLSPMHPVAGAPAQWTEPVTAADERLWNRAAALDRSRDERMRLKREFLALMELRESKPSLVTCAFLLKVGGRTLYFTREGRLCTDRRLFRAEELADLVDLEDAFAKLVARSPYAKARSKGAARRGALELAGFEDARFAACDAAVAQAADDFNRHRDTWTGLKGAALKSVPTLPPLLLKSLVVEEFYWSPEVRIGARDCRQALLRLVRAGIGNDGRFHGWLAALENYGGRTVTSADGERYHAEFAARVQLRAEDPTRYVPAVTRVPAADAGKGKR